MAVRRHIVAARNTSPDALSAALADCSVSAVETADGWCWAMASVWTTGADQLLKALEALEGPALLATTEDGCRWILHLRRAGQEPFSTIHEFCWIGAGESAPENDDYDDIYGEDGDIQLVDLLALPPMPEQRLAPLDFEDDFFEPYADDDENDEDADDDYDETSPLEAIAEAYAERGVALPPELLGELEDLAGRALYRRFLELHAELIAKELARFGIPHDRAEVIRILTGENISRVELDNDTGNLWRFLDHLGLGEQFHRAVVEAEEASRALDEAEPYDACEPVLRHAGDLPLHPVEGGPAVVSVEEAPLLGRIAAALDIHPEFGFRITFESGGDAWPAERPPSYIQVFQYGGGASLYCSGGGVLLAPRARARIGRLLSALPAGARLELLAHGEYARHRFTGKVADGQWLVDAAAVALAPEDIAGLMTVARAAETGAPQMARDEEEAEAIMALASRDMGLYDTMPRRDGLAIQPAKLRDAGDLAGLILRGRFQHRWDTAPIEARLAASFSDWIAMQREIEEESAPPATGECIYQGRASEFRAPDYRAKSIDEGMRNALNQAKDFDRALLELGFAHLGDLVCMKVGGAILRCYANPAEQAFAIAYAAPFGMAWRDLFTRFEDGTTLTSSTSRLESSYRSLRMLVRVTNSEKIARLHQEHRKGIERLEARGMRPSAIEPTLTGIAREIDEFLLRRLGNDGDEA
jgi:hypothetical protein